MSDAEFVMGLVDEERATYFVRDWSKYDPDVGTIPEWEEYSYDLKDPHLVAWREAVATRKDEIKTGMELLLRQESAS